MERAGDGDGAAKNGSEGSPPIGDTRPELKQPNSCTIQREMILRGGIDTAAEQGDRGTGTQANKDEGRGQAERRELFAA